MLATRAAITLAAARLRLARPHSRAAATRPLAASSSAMAAATPKLKLTYFNIKARAEPTRLALFIGGIPFEDIRLSHGEEWPAHKGEMPYGQVPVLEVDGKILAQSYAILMYAGRLSGLVPSDSFQAAKVEEILFHLIDLDVLLAPSGKEADAAKKVALREALAKGPLLTWFGGIERNLAKSKSGWLVGDSLTVADLAAYGRVMSFKLGKYDNIPADVVDNFPLTTALYERVKALPKVAEWNAQPGH